MTSILQAAVKFEQRQDGVRACKRRRVDSEGHILGLSAHKLTNQVPQR